MRKADRKNPQDAGKRISDEQRGVISTLEHEQRSMMRSRDELKRDLTRLDQRIDECTLKADNARSAKHDVQSLKTAIQEIAERRSKILDDLKAQDVDRHIQDGQKRQRILESNRDGLHSELTSLNRQSDTRAKLALKRTDVAKKDETVNTL